MQKMRVKISWHYHFKYSDRIRTCDAATAAWCASIKLQSPRTALNMLRRSIHLVHMLGELVSSADWELREEEEEEWEEGEEGWVE